MALQNFVDKVGPAISAAWANAVDVIKFTIFADAATKAAARTALTSDLPLEIANGGTAARTAAAARTALGSGAAGDSVFISSTSAAARTAISAAVSGANTDITSLGNLTSIGTVGALGAITGLLDLSPASSGQIKFPATQNPSSDVNTLDDYEEGTWTPAVGGTATYSTQTGNYIKVGKLVYLEMYLLINLIGTGSVNTITGLPFAAAAGSANVGGALSVHFFSSLATAVASLRVCVITGSSIELRGVSAGGGTTSETVTGIIGNSTLLALSGCYISNA